MYKYRDPGFLHDLRDVCGVTVPKNSSVLLGYGSLCWTSSAASHTHTHSHNTCPTLIECELLMCFPEN